MTGFKRFSTMHVTMNRVYCSICDRKMSHKHDVCYDRMTKKLVCPECAAMIEADPKATAVAESSHGQIHFNKFSGEVVKFDLDGCDDCQILLTITKFDVKEVCKWWGIRPADSYDILDLGYHYDGGKYEKPDIEWRHMIRTLDIPTEELAKHPISDNIKNYDRMQREAGDLADVDRRLKAANYAGEDRAE